MLRVNQLTGFGAGGASPPYFINGNAGTFSSSATTITWSHTTTAATTCLVVGTFCGNNSGTANVSGVTFNGVSLTSVQKASAAVQGQGGLWVLFNPPIGTFSIVVTSNGSDRGISGQSANFGGATAVNASANTNTSTTDPMTTSLTSTAAGLAVGHKHVNGASGTIATVSVTSPSGMVTCATPIGFLVNSFSKAEFLYYSPTLVASGSSSFTGDVTAGSVAGTSQQYMILT